MNWFSEELQKHRISKGISLNEIALTTRISIHFLEELEQGNFEALPQTYVRAFIREYAVSIGLNPVDVLQRYDLFLGKKLEPAPQPLMPEEPEAGERRRWFSGTTIPVVIILGAIVVTALAVYLFIHLPKSHPVQEIAFDDVVRENEKVASAGKPGQKPKEVEPATTAAGTAVPRTAMDSLRLSCRTTDTVWVSMTMDGKRTEEYLFGPRQSHTWTAKEKFAVTLGNAGGIQFSLNGTPLAPPGRPHAVVRNVVITKESINQREPRAR